MVERHQIYLRRKNGKPKPWSEDPIFQQWRFCNVFRELDTTTVWIRENIRERFAKHPQLWFMLCIARYVNRIETLENLMSKAGSWPVSSTFRLEHLTRALEGIAHSGAPVYTGAYMIRAESDPTKAWYSWTKHRYIAEIVLGRLWKNRHDWARFLDGATTLEEVWREFQQPHYVGWGPFMAYEVVTDLRHTRYLENADDIYSWANAGPGALRGLNRLYGRPLKKPNREAVAEMRVILTAINPYWHPLELEMRDIEHSLCEFDKYERVRLGEGKPRNRYDGIYPRNLDKRD